MTAWLALIVILALVAYRVTRVITKDSLTEAARDRLYRWAWVEPDEPEAYARARVAVGSDDVPFENEIDDDAQPLPRNGGTRTYVNELFNCAWCMGVWVSLAVTAFYVWVVADGLGLAWSALLAGAVAGLQGLIASRPNA